MVNIQLDNDSLEITEELCTALGEEEAQGGEAGMEWGDEPSGVELSQAGLPGRADLLSLLTVVWALGCVSGSLSWARCSSSLSFKVSVGFNNNTNDKTANSIV